MIINTCKQPHKTCSIHIMMDPRLHPPTNFAVHWLYNIYISIHPIIHPSIHAYVCIHIHNAELLSPVIVGLSGRVPFLLRDTARVFQNKGQQTRYNTHLLGLMITQSSLSIEIFCTTTQQENTVCSIFLSQVRKYT